MNQKFTEAVDALRRALREREWHFEETDSEENYTFTLTVTGDDLPMDACCMIDYNRSLATGMSFLPIAVDKEHMVDMAIGVNLINYMLSVGSFDYNVLEGKLLFRINTFITEGEGNVGQMNKLINLLFGITDEYNELLMLLSKGLITLEQLNDKLQS